MTDHDFRPVIAAKDAEIEALKADKESQTRTIQFHMGRAFEAEVDCGEWKRKAEAAEAQLAKERGDTARMDWFEENRRLMHFWLSRPEEVLIYPSESEWIAGRGANLREAIDAAREKGGEK